MSIFPLIGGDDDDDDDDTQSLQRLVWGSGLKVVNPSGKWSIHADPIGTFTFYCLITTEYL